MPLPPKELAALKKNLNAARGGPVNFAVCLGTKPDGLVLLLDRSKQPRTLATLAKSQGETNKTFWGDLNVDSNRARFKCEGDPVSGALPQLKKFFETNKLGFKPEFGTDIDDDVRDGADKGRSFGANDDMSPELKLWRKVDAQIEAKVRTLMKAKVKPSPKAMSAWKELRKRAQRGDLRWAIRKAPQVLKLMEPPRPKVEFKGLAKGPVKKGQMLVLVRQMVQRLKGNISPQQEKYLKAAVTQAKKGQDDKAAALLRAAQKLAA